MATTQVIGLRIYGNKERAAGTVPLVSVGVMAGGKSIFYDDQTSVEESPAFVLRHLQDYIIYEMIDNTVLLIDSVAHGVLGIALSVPANKQFANGASPYTLLTEAYDTFMSTYMKPTADGHYKYLESEYNRQLFVEILSHYELEDRQTTYVPMSPSGRTGVVCVPRHTLRSFFRNTQYPEFAQYHKIEVGTHCQPTPGLDNLQIPLLQSSYEVYIDGEPTGVKLQLPESPSYKATKRPNSYYTYDSVMISLIELLNTPGHEVISGKSRIKLDMGKSRILCDLGKSDVYYEFVLGWSGNADNGRERVKALAAQRILHLYFGNEDLTDILLTGVGPKIKAKDISGRKADILPKSYKNYIFSAQSSLDDKQHKILVNITINKRQIIEKPVAPARDANHDQSRPLGMSNAVNTAPNQSKIPNDKPAKKRRLNRKLFFVNLIVFLLGILLGILISFLTNNGDQEARLEEQNSTEYAVDPQDVHEDEQRKSGEYDNQDSTLRGKIDASDVDVGGAQNTPSQEEIAQQEKMAKQKTGVAKKEAEEKAAKKKKAEQEKQQAFDHLIRNLELAKRKVNVVGKHELNKIKIPNNASDMTLNEIFALDKKIHDILREKANLR